MAVPLVSAVWLIASTADTELKKRRAVISGVWFYFCFYLLLMTSLLCLRYVAYIDYSRYGEYFVRSIKYNVNLIPFKTILDYMSRINTNTSVAVYNLAGNLAVFAPMGFFLPTLFPRLRRFGKFTLTMLFIIVLAECCQLLLQTGTFDVDDITLNLLGAVLAFWIWRLSFMQKLMQRTCLLECS